jgi:hypothetical protein
MISLMLSGCAIFNLGENESRIEEMGCDFSDAGVPLDPYYVLHNRHKIKDIAYKDVNCKLFKNKEE